MTNRKPQAAKRPAEIVREYGPFQGVKNVGGVTHDGHQVWAATGPALVAFDPSSGETTRRIEQGALLALLSDGAPWSTSALALALGASQRTVPRALAELEAEGRVRALGATRARRWLAPPLTGFTTVLLLPAALPSG